MHNDFVLNKVTVFRVVLALLFVVAIGLALFFVLNLNRTSIDRQFSPPAPNPSDNIPQVIPEARSYELLRGYFQQYNSQNQTLTLNLDPRTTNNQPNIEVSFQINPTMPITCWPERDSGPDLANASFPTFYSQPDLSMDFDVSSSLNSVIETLNSNTYLFILTEQYNLDFYRSTIIPAAQVIIIGC